MLAISLKFPAKRFHATPWGRQVNEGAVEWPPSPWRLLRSLIATWRHKFPDVPEEVMRELIEQLAPPPRFVLPKASQGHTRHYMPLVNDDRTKVFDTFIALEPDDAVVVVWPNLTLSDEQRQLLDQLLRAMTYFGRAESWVCGELLDEAPLDSDAVPVELGEPAEEGHELVRTLVPVLAEEHIAWFTQTRETHRRRKLTEQVAAATAKGKPADKLKLSNKDEQAIDASLPATLFDALHADTAELRKAGWNQPPGTRWINYARPADAFSPQPRARKRNRRTENLPTVARFAVCGAVRPLLTDAIIIGEQVRRVVMGCSKAYREDHNAASVFSGKHDDGSPLSAGHQHAHFLCEAASGDGKISHVTIYAPAGFDAADERAFSQLARSGVWGRDGYELQLVLLGVGQPQDFGGIKEKAGQSPILSTAKVWESRTPFVLTRHLTRKGMPSTEAINADPKLRADLIDAVRVELAQRDKFKLVAGDAEIEPLLSQEQMGTDLGGHFTSWLKFRRERLNGGGSKAGSHGFGFRLTFSEDVTGPITLGYGCHFGLGVFSPVRSE
jgi:CRISPR-associated protein Csb2